MPKRNLSLYLFSGIFLVAWVLLLYYLWEDESSKFAPTLLLAGVFFIFFLFFARKYILKGQEKINEQNDLSEEARLLITKKETSDPRLGKCLSCDKKLGPNNTVLTTCEHEFHETCFLNFQNNSVDSSTLQRHCPDCLKISSAVTNYCFNAKKKVLKQVLKEDFV